MASTVNKCTTDMKLLKFINEIYSPYNKAHSAKPHKIIIMHHHHKQSIQNSSTKSKEKYTSITSSFQSVQYSITKKMQTYLNKYNSNVEMYNMKVIMLKHCDGESMHSQTDPRESGTGGNPMSGSCRRSLRSS